MAFSGHVNNEIDRPNAVLKAVADRRRDIATEDSVPLVVDNPERVTAMLEGVEADNLPVGVLDQMFDKVASGEARAAGDDDSFHVVPFFCSHWSNGRSVLNCALWIFHSMY